MREDGGDRQPVRHPAARERRREGAQVRGWLLAGQEDMQVSSARASCGEEEEQGKSTHRSERLLAGSYGWDSTGRTVWADAPAPNVAKEEGGNGLHSHLTVNGPGP